VKQKRSIGKSMFCLISCTEFREWSQKPWNQQLLLKSIFQQGSVAIETSAATIPRSELRFGDFDSALKTQIEGGFFFAQRCVCVCVCVCVCPGSVACLSLTNRIVRGDQVAQRVPKEDNFFCRTKTTRRHNMSHTRTSAICNFSFSFPKMSDSELLEKFGS
jgi:hypothetical protein